MFAPDTVRLFTHKAAERKNTWEEKIITSDLFHAPVVFLSSTQQLGSLPNLSGGHHLHRIFHISLVSIFIRQKAARLNQALENQVIRLYLLSPLRIFATR